jgi:hypothetical protein
MFTVFGDALQLGRFVGVLHQLLVDVDAEPARAEYLGGGEDNAAVARAQVDDEILRAHLGEFEHVRHHAGR